MEQGRMVPLWEYSVECTGFQRRWSIDDSVKPESRVSVESIESEGQLEGMLHGGTPKGPVVKVDGMNFELALIASGTDITTAKKLIHS